MAVTFSEKFNISYDELTNLGVFDSIIDVDTKFFIDPALIALCKDSEFIEARSKIQRYFSDIITLLRHSKQVGDRFWKEADRRLTFKEIVGTCIGYSESGTSGNAIGKELRCSILKSVKQLIEEGENDPVLFELLGVFQERIGCDRISDLITFILHKELLTYTHRIVEHFGINDCSIKYQGEVYKSCYNPFNKKPILLLPRVLLSPLPVAVRFEDIDWVCQENARVRAKINEFFEWKNGKDISKSDIFKLLKDDKEFRQAFINSYKKIPPVESDFYDSKSGEYIWYTAAKLYVQQYPLGFESARIHNITQVEEIVWQICQQFKNLVENNGLNQLLYDSKKQPKHEPAAQLLFYGIADAYCKANNIDLSREVNNGRGPVDFKLSHGADDKVLVEVKLSSNPQLEHGIEKQLPIYMTQEGTHRAIYLIIDNGHPKKIEKFRALYNSLDTELQKRIKCIIIDATLKDSASKA